MGVISLPCMDEINTQQVQRYKVTLSYDGTDFNGWQIQHKEVTVQGVIEEILHKILPRFGGVVGCGRTDTGVHARDYVLHLDSIPDIDVNTLMYKMNKMLPEAVNITDIESVDHGFHARFSARSRSYEYTMATTKQPFDYRHRMIYPYHDDIDVERLNAAAEVFIRHQDFYTFCKSKSDVQTTFCHIEECHWSHDSNSDLYTFRITANRFLRGQIRLMVGACLNVNRGKLSLVELDDALKLKQRLRIDWSVPACGLMLCDVRY